MKSKIPLGKKPKVESEESNESESNVEASAASDKTGVTDISKENLDESTQNDVSSSDAAENKSLVHKLKQKFEEFQAKKKGQTSDNAPVEEGSTPSVNDAALAKKKRLIIIGLIAIGAIVLIPFEEENVEVAEAPIKLKPRKKPVKPVKPKTENAAAETSENTPVDTSSASTQSDSPQVDGGVQPVEALPADTTSTVSTTPTETSTIESAPIDSVTETTGTENSSETPPVTSDMPSIDLPSDFSQDSGSTATDLSTASTAPSESIDSFDGTITTDTSSSDNITDQILEDLEKQVETKKPVEVKKVYVSPPDYEYFGRGLVYNCSGKHWACVDAPSYKTCEDNSSSVKYLNKKKECYPFNVYETAKGCQSVQNRMVSSSAKTNFCD